MDLNKQIELLKQALEKTTNFDDEQEKIDFILDVTSEYKQLLLPNVVEQSKQLKCHHQYMNAGTLQGKAMKKCLKCGDYVKAL